MLISLFRYSLHVYEYADIARPLKVRKKTNKQTLGLTGTKKLDCFYNKRLLCKILTFNIVSMATENNIFTVTPVVFLAYYVCTSVRPYFYIVFKP